MDLRLYDLFLWLIKYGIVQSDMDPDSLLALKRLDLSGYKFEYLPDEIGLLTQLHTLNLSNNRLEALPSTLGNLTSLINLDLRRNHLNDLSPLAPLNLRSLNISFNKIRSLEALKGMKELRVLDVSANELVSVSSLVDHCTELRNLNASYNYLERFTVSPSIETLNLCQNTLYEVSAAEGISLLRADCSDNQLETIPAFLSHSDVQSLDLSSNRLRHIIIEGMNSLESLTLDNNPLETIVFDDNAVTGLEELSCAGCGLHEMVLPQSDKLSVIDFSSNRIEMLEDSFAAFPNLEEIDVSNNRLSALPVSIGKITSLKTLYAEDNPLELSALNEIMSWNIEQCFINVADPVVIERASLSDLPMMAELLAQLFTIEQDFEIDYEKQYAGLSMLSQEANADLFVAKSNNKIIGMVTMQRVVSTAEGGYAGLIEDLIVDAEFREMKIGTRLIRKMIQIASEKGYCRIQLAADQHNENGLTFYRQRGFKQTNLTIFHFIDMNNG